MIDCNATREQLALEPTTTDQVLLDHLTQCAACAAYRRQHHSLDGILRGELQWKAPNELTARLLMLASVSWPAMPLPSRPKHWYVTTVYALSLTAILLSCLIAWKFFGLLALQIGLGSAFAQFVAALPQGIRLLTETLPESRYAIAFFLKVRDQLMWLLLAAVLWAVLDKWNMQWSIRRRPFSS